MQIIRRCHCSFFISRSLETLGLAIIEPHQTVDISPAQVKALCQMTSLRYCQSEKTARLRLQTKKLSVEGTNPSLLLCIVEGTCCFCELHCDITSHDSHKMCLSVALNISWADSSAEVVSLGCQWERTCWISSQRVDADIHRYYRSRRHKGEMSLLQVW